MELKKTCTSIFMVPTLKIDKDQLKENNFLNGYIKDIKRDEQYNNAVYVLFKPDNLMFFKEFVYHEYDRSPQLIDDYDYEGGFVVLVYMLDPMFKHDFNLVKEGKYSKTSSEFQELFPKVKKIMKNGLHKDELSLQYRIFNKTEDLKEYWEKRIDQSLPPEMEVWGKFNEEDETLDIDKITQLV